MQNIADFWKTATGKIAILGGGGVLGLLSLCFTCAVCGTIFGDSSDRPVETTRDIVSFSTEEPTPLPTATLEPTSTPQPTATTIPIVDTPEQTPALEPEPTDTPEEKQVPLVTTDENNVNMRSGPGTEYDVVGTLEAGQSLEIVGRNADSSRWQVSTSDGLSWVADSVVTASNADDSIPVVEAPPAPFPTEPPPAVESTSESQPTEIVPTEQPPAEICDCSGNHLNCPDFGTHASAQACYEYCISIGRGDVHGLDRDDDGTACDPTSWD